tara:strand:+ start:3770 stop:4036 length:267 start_codon:yes stop_codon:yes gene_type:complete
MNNSFPSLVASSSFKQIKFVFSPELEKFGLPEFEKKEEESLRESVSQKPKLRELKPLALQNIALILVTFEVSKLDKLRVLKLLVPPNI